MRALSIVLVLLAGGCALDPGSGEGRPCRTYLDCLGAQGYFCQAVDAGDGVDAGVVGICVLFDAAAFPDSGRDAGTDGGRDTGAMDGGAVDTGAMDTGAVDTGAVDTGASDGGSDAGPMDTGAADVGADAGDDAAVDADVDAP